MAGCLRVLALALPLLLSACREPVDLKQAVHVVDVSTGWHDAGIVEGKNKVVPSITFRIRKSSPDAPITALALNVVFKAEGDTEQFDEIFLQRVEIGPDGQSPPITVRAERGYTGDPPQSRADILKHTQFRDLEAQILGRQGSRQWIELHRVKVERRLLAN
jgi:hypothetical protein